MSARDEILGRVRAALADGPTPPTVGGLPAATGLGPAAELLDLFVERVADYRAVVVAVRRRRGRRAGSPWPSTAARAVVPAGAAVGRAGRRRRRPAHRARARRDRRGGHRGRRRHRRDRHHRARPRRRPGPAGADARARPARAAWSAPTRSSPTYPRRSPLSTRSGRRPGSAARRPPATSSSTASRASTAPAGWSSSWPGVVLPPPGDDDRRMSHRSSAVAASLLAARRVRPAPREPGARGLGVLQGRQDHRGADGHPPGLGGQREAAAGADQGRRPAEGVRARGRCLARHRPRAQGAGLHHRQRALPERLADQPDRGLEGRRGTRCRCPVDQRLRYDDDVISWTTGPQCLGKYDEVRVSAETQTEDDHDFSPARREWHPWVDRY